MTMTPHPKRERKKTQTGSNFYSFELSDGNVLMRCAKAPRHSLVWHMCRLSGLRFERNRERIQD